MPRLYDELADLWCALSTPADYAAEAKQLLALFPPAPADRPRRVLDLGCGAGRTLVHLAAAEPDAELVGLDLSPAMLAHAAALVPGAQFVADDMRTFDLGETFDLVLLHDAADYLTRETDMRACMTRCAAHLAPGGTLIVAPTYLKETFAPAAAMDADDADRPRLFSVTHDPEPTDDTFELVLLCLVPEGDPPALRLVEDRHTCGLFAAETWRTALADVGLEVEVQQPDGDAAVWDAVFLGRRR